MRMVLDGARYGYPDLGAWKVSRPTVCLRTRWTPAHETGRGVGRPQLAHDAGSRAGAMGRIATRSEPCGIDDCPFPTYRLGWCRGHYDRYVRYGDPRPEVPLGELGTHGRQRGPFRRCPECGGKMTPWDAKSWWCLNERRIMGRHQSEDET